MDRDPELEKFKAGSGINHSGSATLQFCFVNMFVCLLKPEKYIQHLIVILIEIVIVAEKYMVQAPKALG